MSGKARSKAHGNYIWRSSGSVFQFIIGNWKAVAFSAALAVVLDRLGFLRVLSKVSLLVVSSLASHSGGGIVNVTPSMPVVVVINGDDFNTRYAERSPLNRCVLQADIAKVLAKSPSRLAIDFDLSPVADASDSERRCQQKLDTLLDQHAGQLVLLVPFPAMGPQLFDLKRSWIQDRCRAKLHFADGNIEQSLGLVTEQLAGLDEQLSARMANQLQNGFSNLVCDSVVNGSDPRNNSWLTDVRAVVQPERETQPINFPKAIERLAVIPLGSSAFDALPSLESSPVLLGGDWGKDDSFLTSIGSLPGVVVHAAGLISLLDPIEPLSPWVNLLSDVGIALCFAWVIEQFWEHYVMARRLDIAFQKQGQVTGLSSLVMVTFVCIYLGLVLFFFFVAEYMFVHRNVVIAPLLIALSMVIDGFVSGPVEAIDKLLKHGVSKEEIALGFSKSSPESRSILRALFVSWAGLLGYVVLYAIAPDLEKLASAYGFLGTLFIVYLLFSLHLLLLPFRSLRNYLRGTPSTSYSEHTQGKPADKAEASLGLTGFFYWLAKCSAMGRQLVFWLTLALALYFLSGNSLHF